MENKAKIINMNTNEKEEKIMQYMELFEYEKIQYIKGMEDYLQKLKSLSHDEAVKKSRENLIKSKIIQEDGEFTEQYKYSKMYMEKKR